MLVAEILLGRSGAETFNRTGGAYTNGHCVIGGRCVLVPESLRVARALNIDHSQAFPTEDLKKNGNEGNLSTRSKITVKYKHRITTFVVHASTLIARKHSCQEKKTTATKQT